MSLISIQGPFIKTISYRIKAFILKTNCFWEWVLWCNSKQISESLFDLLSKNGVIDFSYDLTRAWHIFGLLISFTLQLFANFAFYFFKTIWQFFILDICFWKRFLSSKSQTPSGMNYLAYNHCQGQTMGHS